MGHELTIDVPAMLDRQIPEIEDRCLYLDNELGGYIATRSVLERGHRAIAYISGPLWKDDATSRLAGHRRALEEFGVEYDPSLFYEGNFEESGGNRGMEHLLQVGRSFSAVICANDEMAAGAFGVARERDILIPDEISIMGFDNVFFTPYFRPRLSRPGNGADGRSLGAERGVRRHGHRDPAPLRADPRAPVLGGRKVRSLIKRLRAVPIRRARNSGPPRMRSRN